MATKRYISKIPWDIIEELSPKRHSYSNTEAFIYLSTHACYIDEQETVRGIVCKKGQLVTSSRELSIAFGWPETNVRRYLMLLVKKEYIVYKTVANATKITVLPLADKATIEESKQESGALSGAPDGADFGAGNGAPNPAVNQILAEISGAPIGALNGAVSGVKAAHIARVHTRIDIIDINNIICICKKYSPELIFEAWWSLYDNKKSRKTARSKWLKLPPEIWAKAIIQTIAYVNATPEKEYRKHPDTYLNGECWNDEVTMPVKKIEPKKEPTLQERHTAFVQWLANTVKDNDAMRIFGVTLDDFIEMLKDNGGDAKTMASAVIDTINNYKPITIEERLIGAYRRRKGGMK